MNAVACRRHGPPEVLEVIDVERPPVPENGVLVRVHASSVNPVDFFTLSAVHEYQRLLATRFRSRPQVVGHDFSGTVEAVGAAVTGFRPGDQLFGGKPGAMAEYVCVPAQDAIAPMPAGVTFEAAAGVAVAALTALQALRDHGRVRPGQRVLVNGASGGVGTFAVQLAKALGAEVTAVCSPGNVDLARSLGADDVVDYTREDFTRSGRRCDLLLDVAGSRSWSECRRVLAPGATLVAVGGSSHTVYGGVRTLGHLAAMRLASIGSRERAALFVAKLNQADLRFVGELMAAGRVRTVVDRCYSMDQAAAAFRYLGEGHARGKVVVTVRAAG